MMVEHASGEVKRVDATTIATSYRRILGLIDEVCDKLTGIRREADLMMQMDGREGRDDRRDQ